MGHGEKEKGLQTPRAESAPLRPDLLVLFQMLNLGFLTHLEKVISPTPLIIKEGKFCSAESVNKTLRASLQVCDHYVLEHNSWKVSWRVWLQERGGSGGRRLLRGLQAPAFPSFPHIFSALFIFSFEQRILRPWKV